jgi:hypothetical protein
MTPLRHGQSRSSLSRNRGFAPRFRGFTYVQRAVSLVPHDHKKLTVGSAGFRQANAPTRASPTRGSMRLTFATLWTRSSYRQVLPLRRPPSMTARELPAMGGRAAPGGWVATPKRYLDALIADPRAAHQSRESGRAPDAEKSIWRLASELVPLPSSASQVPTITASR